MKNIVLALCLMVAPVASIRAADSSHNVDPYTMIQNLQRVINTSTNTRDIMEAERLIREVYGPECDRQFWKNVKIALKLTGGLCAVGVVIGTLAALTK
ncbi:MAG: hypothetical protein AB7F19_03385 [Candidatus Babeliales bacterium]